MSEAAERLSLEQRVRNILEQAGRDGLLDGRDPQSLSSGDVIAMANMLNEYARADVKVKDEEMQRRLYTQWVALEGYRTRLEECHARLSDAYGKRDALHEALLQIEELVSRPSIDGERMSAVWEVVVRALAHFNGVAEEAYRV